MAISFYNLTLKFVWIPDSVVRNTLLCKCLHYKNMLHKSFSLKGFLFFFCIPHTKTSQYQYFSDTL